MAFFARFAFLACWSAFKCGVIAFCAEFVVLFFAVLFLPAFAVGSSAGALIFWANAAIGDHAKVMVGKLKIVFGLNTVAIQMGVRCQLAILLQHLGGVAPCATVDPVELLSTILWATVIGAPATAVVTTIVVIQLQALPCLGAAQLEFRPIWNAGSTRIAVLPVSRAISTTGSQYESGFPASALVPAPLAVHPCKW